MLKPKRAFILQLPINARAKSNKTSAAASKKKAAIKDISYFKSGLFALVFLGILAGLTFWINLSEKDLVATGVDVAGTISDAGGNSLTVSYNFNGRRYKAVGSVPHRSIENGEVYNVKINPHNPKDFSIQFWKPIFKTGDFAKGKLNSIDKLWFSNHVKFSYTVHGEAFYRIQTLPPSLSIDSLTSAILLYNRDTPSTAYLLFK
ncbi:hypothetical protein [Mucilaginibacter psychrotolerans]|uniref:DUF3592 domain-containing protein n=1 Tax=Mucilaginibacter psychrotolerans TaxID=1524096 RepID=A0A4Y8SE42_9SPHI|nr:hypothetical protein [Mucilaginibacter psychrotolerans]TFF36931.1 hypothetical protein E2R66_14315 [Mucilaginibacter psychrotolerans]